MTTASARDLSHRFASPPLRRFAFSRISLAAAVVLMGGGLVWHLWSLTSMSFSGPAAWNRGVAERRRPLMLLLEFGVLFPVLLLYLRSGLQAWWRTRPNTARFPYAGNWLRRVQHATAPLLLGFILIHVWQMQIRPWWEGKAVTAEFVARQIPSLLALDGYILGAGLAAWHAGYGAWSAAIRLGVLVGPKAQLQGAWAAALLGLVLAGLGFHAAAAFHDTRYVLTLIL